MPKIKKALGIEGVYTESSVWKYSPPKEEKGAQVDMVLDRQDMCINLCEMKFTRAPFVIDKKYAAELNNKLNVFRDQTKTKKTLFLTMVTTWGTQKNNWYTGLVQNEVTMDALFSE